MSNTLLRKVTATAAALSIVLSIVAPVVGVKAADDNTAAANRLAALGVIVDNSKDPSKYNLGSNITRREMLKVMMNLSSVEVGNTCEGKFSDLPASDWGCKYAEAALKAGFIAANKKFRPNDLVTEAEALKMVMQARGVAKTEGIADWAQAYADAAVKAKIIAEGTKVSTKSAKRSFVIVSADSAVTNTTGNQATGDNSSDDLGGLFGDLFGNEGTDMTGSTASGSTTVSTGTTNTVASGDLDVSLNPASPANGSAIPMSGIVKFAAVDLTAGSSDVSVNSVEIKKASLSQVSTNTKVWFEKNGKRVSARTSFTSEGNAVVTFAPAYVVKAGTTETLDMLVELSDQTGGTDYSFVSGDISASAVKISGSFVTSTLRTSNYSVATFKLEDASAGGSTYNVNGDEVYELGAFKITATKPSTVTETRDLNFKTVTLYQSGSANLTSLKDITLERNGTKVSSNVTVDGKTLTIQLNDTIKDGATATYYVKAKVAYVEKTSDTYQFYTKNTSDVVVDEISSGIRSKAETSYSILTNDAYTVKGSDLSFTKDDSVSLSATYAPGTSNVVLMQGYITANQAVNLENVWLDYDVTGLTSTSALSDYFSTAYMAIGNSSLSATVSTATGTVTGKLKFSGTVTVNGKVPVKVYANLKSGSSLKDLTLKLADLKLDSFGKDNGRNEYVSNQETISSSVGSISGISVTIGTSTLSTTRTDGLGDTTIAAGLKGVTVFGAKLTSTQGNPVRVTGLTFNFTGSTDLVNNAYATLYVNGTAVKSKTINQEAIKFDGFNFDVSTSKSADILVKVDFSDAFSSGNFKATLASGNATDTISSADLSSKITTLAGAKFTISAASATLALSNDNPKKSLVTAGQTGIKLLTFRLTAKNDKVNVKKVVFSGSKLDSFTSYSLKDSSGKVVSSVSTDSSSVTFDNISADTFAVSQDATSDLYVYADAKTNTNTGSTVLSLSGMTIRGSNGKELTSSGTDSATTFAYTANSIISNGADVYENTAKIVAVSPVSKNLSSDAARFSLFAAGKNSVTFTGITLKATLSGYNTGATTEVQVRKVNGDDLVATGTLAYTTDGSEMTATSWAIDSTKTTIDAGKTETYYVKVITTIRSGAQQSDWTIKISNVQVDSNGNTINLSDYPSNTDTLPLTSSK